MPTRTPGASNLSISVPVAALNLAGDTLGTFRASGYEGQSITLCPSLDLMVVRLGKTPHEHEENLVPWRKAMVQAFARAR